MKRREAHDFVENAIEYVEEHEYFDSIDSFAFDECQAVDIIGTKAGKHYHCHVYQQSNGGYRVIVNLIR